MQRIIIFKVKCCSSITQCIGSYIVCKHHNIESDILSDFLGALVFMKSCLYTKIKPYKTLFVITAEIMW